MSFLYYFRKQSGAGTVIQVNVIHFGIIILSKYRRTPQLRKRFSIARLMLTRLPLRVSEVLAEDTGHLGMRQTSIVRDT